MCGIYVLALDQVTDCHRLIVWASVTAVEDLIEDQAC